MLTAFGAIREEFTRKELLRSKADGRRDTPTSKKGPDLELFRKEIKKLRATRGNTRDDVDDLPESLPVGGTTAMFFTPKRKLEESSNSDRDEDIPPCKIS